MSIQSQTKDSYNEEANHLSCPSPNYIPQQETLLFGLALFAGNGV